MIISKYQNILKKRFFFISGCPRSGTSFLVKVIDSHPNVGILMEQTFGNRRRLNLRSKSWKNRSKLKQKTCKILKRISEPIIGNKVCCPDVWTIEDILQFCSIWPDHDIIWILRNPVDVLVSRHNREASDHYSKEARELMPLNFKTNFTAWASSWSICVQNYITLKHKYPDKLHLVYYEDLITNFEQTVGSLFTKLGLSQANEVHQYHQMAHYSALGKKEFNLKYKDSRAHLTPHIITDELRQQISEALEPYAYHIGLFENKTLI
jgi:hypothetical protein